MKKLVIFASIISTLCQAADTADQTTLIEKIVRFKFFNIAIIMERKQPGSSRYILSFICDEYRHSDLNLFINKEHKRLKKETSIDLELISSSDTEKKELASKADAIYKKRYSEYSQYTQQFLLPTIVYEKE